MIPYPEDDDGMEQNILGQECLLRRDVVVRPLQSIPAVARWVGRQHQRNHLPGLSKSASAIACRI